MTIKTFDSDRVGGGTFQLEQDPTTGEYKLKEVGFVKLPQLKLPEIEQAAFKVPTPYTSGDDTSTFEGTNLNIKQNEGEGGGGNRLDFTGTTQFKNIQKEATGGDMMKEATTLSSQLNRVDKSDINQGAIRVEDIRSLESMPQSYQDLVGEYNRHQANVQEKNRSGNVSNEQGLEDMMYSRELRTQINEMKGQSFISPAVAGIEGAGVTTTAGRADAFTMDAAPIGDFSQGPKTVTGATGVPDAIKFGQPSLPDSTLMSKAKAKATDVLTNFKPVSLMAIDALSNAITSPLQERSNIANTTALRSNGYVTDFQGKVIGKDGQAVSAADSVFGGMNSRSAFGDVSKGAQNRIDTISNTISKMTPAQKAKSSLPARKEKFEKELADHNRDKEQNNINDAKSKGVDISSLNPNEMRNVATTGSPGGDNGCFIKGTLITMFDGSKKPVEQVDLGDNVAIGGNVFAVGRFLNTELYDYKGIKVSGSHMVNEDGTWMRVKDTKHGKSLGDDLNTVYVFGSENRRILIDDILFTDYFEVSEQDQLIEDSEDFFNNWKSYGNNINEHNVNTLNAS